MYTQEISIEINSSVKKIDLFEAFELLMSFYRGSGQTQGRIESQYRIGNKIVALPYTHEKNSLADKRNNFYVRGQIKKVERLFNSKLQFKTAGKSDALPVSVCLCKKSSFYLLVTNYLSISSPITCGTCNKSVPLYRLPIYYDHGYMPILRWETNYISCDRLQMNCEVGEKWATKQMTDPKSDLSKQGIKICSKIKELTGVPTFYYLFNYRRLKVEKDKKRACPSCGGQWLLKKQLHGLYDFKCDKCELISSITSNGY